jgi:DNA/RNA endonuclease YhcR with UshA esterase domain
MRTLVVALGLALATLPARAQVIGSAEAKAHAGQTVTVKAAIADVRTLRSGMTFIDIGGSYPDNDFAAVIFAPDAAKFPNIGALKGKTVAISGPVQIYQGKPEIILKTADQLKAN